MVPCLPINTAKEARSAYRAITALYINSGAQGFINGGIVSIAGKPSESHFAAIQINEPSFFFGDNSLILVRNGNSTDLRVCEIKTAPGVSLGKLKVDADKKLVVRSLLQISTSLYVNPGAEIEIESGNILNLGN